MNCQHWIAIIGALSGTLGSIITVFSLTSVIRELNIARDFLEITVKQLTLNESDIYNFEGLDERYHKASKWSTKASWIGVILLAIGFILQAVNIFLFKV